LKAKKARAARKAVKAAEAKLSADEKKKPEWLRNRLRCFSDLEVYLSVRQYDHTG
jgi:hypothetical protein